MPILRMLASTGEEHTRPTPRGCDLIKGIITLSELFTANYLCYDYTYTIVISPTAYLMFHYAFYIYQNVSSDIRCNQQQERSRKGRHMP